MWACLGSAGSSGGRGGGVVGKARASQVISPPPKKGIGQIALLRENEIRSGELKLEVSLFVEYLIFSGAHCVFWMDGLAAVF